MAHGAAYDAASWEEQAQEISGSGIVALAPENTSLKNLLDSIEYLKEERGAQDVALMGASAGGSAVLRAATEEPDAADQLILLSATGDVTGLGEEPKLFVASEGEDIAKEVRRIAEEAPAVRTRRSSSRATPTPRQSSVQERESSSWKPSWSG